MDGPVSIPYAAAGIERPFEPRDLVVANDAVVRIAAIEGEFRIELEGLPAVEMHTGDLFTVPRGVEHRPVTPTRAIVLLWERPETLQFGNR